MFQHGDKYMCSNKTNYSIENDNMTAMAEASNRPTNGNKLEIVQMLWKNEYLQRDFPKSLPRMFFYRLTVFCQEKLSSLFILSHVPFQMPVFLILRAADNDEHFLLVTEAARPA